MITANYLIFGRKYNSISISEISFFGTVVPGNFRGLTISPNGDRLFVLNYSTSVIYQYNLVTPNLLSTAVANGNKAFGIASIYTLSFSRDGLICFTSHVNSTTLYQRPLTTAFEISTLAGTILNKAGFDTVQYTFQQLISHDGTKLHRVQNGSADKIQVFNLSTPYNVTSAAVGYEFSITAKWYLFYQNGNIVVIGREGYMELRTLSTPYDMSTKSGKLASITFSSNDGKYATKSDNESYIYLSRNTESTPTGVVQYSINFT